jgi:GcrA cell cycle regulator
MPSWWTEERVTELKTRWANGQTGREIWHAMGAISRSAVIGKVHRLGLDGRFAIAAKNANNTRNGIRARRRSKRKTVHHVDGRVFFVTGEQAMIEEDPPSFANPKTIMELRDHHCRWPGAGEMPDLLFCGAPVANGYPYCPAHCRIAFAPYLPRPPKAPRQ